MINLRSLSPCYPSKSWSIHGKSWMIEQGTVRSRRSLHYSSHNNDADDLNSTSVQSFDTSWVPSILPPRVRVPRTPPILFSMYIWIVSCGKDENKRKRGQEWPIKKLFWHNLAQYCTTKVFFIYPSTRRHEKQRIILNEFFCWWFLTGPFGRSFVRYSVGQKAINLNL